MDETLRMRVPRTIQGMLTPSDDLASATVMDRRRRQPVQARMVVNVVVPAEEVAAERLGILNTAETFGESRSVLQRLELGFGKRVVIGYVRPGVGLAGFWCR